MGQAEAQIIGIASLVLGVLLVAVPWRLVRRRQWSMPVLLTLTLLLLLGAFVFMVGFFFTWYAFNPDAGR